VWHAFKGNVGVDFVWLSVHESPIAFGKATDAGMGVPEMQSALQRFETVANCSPGLALGYEVIASDRAFEAPSYIASNACNLRDDTTMADLGDLAGHIRGTIGGMESWNGVPFYALDPITGGPNSPDRVIFTVHENATAWATRMGDLVTSDAGQALGRHFGKLMDCSVAFWLGEQVIAPE